MEPELLECISLGSVVSLSFTTPVCLYDVGVAVLFLRLLCLVSVARAVVGQITYQTLPGYRN